MTCGQQRSADLTINVRTAEASIGARCVQSCRRNLGLDLAPAYRLADSEDTGIRRLCLAASSGVTAVVVATVSCRPPPGTHTGVLPFALPI